jgi:hypothetical protein
VKTGTGNTVGKNPKPIPLLLLPVFPSFFPVFPIFLIKRFTVGLDGLRCQLGRDFPVLFLSLSLLEV